MKIERIHSFLNEELSRDKVMYIINTFFNIDTIGVLIFAFLYVICEAKISFLINSEF